ncbi:Flagellum site-determining protein YlxH [compost metagenome]
MGHKVPFRLVINRVTDHKEGKQTANKISLVAKQFLQLDIPTLGFVDDDNNVSKAVKKQIPFTLAFPHTAATRDIQLMVDHYVNGYQPAETASSGVKGFLSKMMNLLK